MKRILVMLLLTVCMARVGCAEKYDFSGYSDEQLSELQTLLEREKAQRKNRKSELAMNRRLRIFSMRRMAKKSESTPI